MKIWPPLKTVLLSVLIFGAGAVAGGVVTIRFIERRVHERIDDRNWSRLTLNWLDRELSFSNAQREQVEPIVQQATLELKGVRDETELRRRAILGVRLKEVRKHLTPQQQEKLRLAVERVRRQVRYVGAPFR